PTALYSFVFRIATAGRQPSTALKLDPSRRRRAGLGSFDAVARNQSIGGPAKGTVWSNELTTPLDRLRISTNPGSLYADQIRSDPNPPSRASRSRAPGITCSRSNV